MKITYEANTQETRIADLERKYKYSKICDSLFERAMRALKLGKTVIYTINGNTGKVKSIQIIKTIN